MEWLFSWEATSVFVGILITIGLGVLALNDFKAAKVFFMLATADAAGGISMWGANSPMPPVARTLIVFVATGLIGIFAVQSIRYVNRKSAASLAESKPQAETLRSYLMLSLVIDQVDKDFIHFHLLLENRGTSEINVNQLFYESQSGTSTEGTMSPVRRMIPGGDLRKNGMILRKDYQSPLIATATYHIVGDDQPFTAKYIFPIRSIDLHPQKVLEPSSRDESIGELDVGPQKVWDGLKQPIGSLTFWFPDRLPNGNVNALAISAGDNRRIAFDPVSRLVHLTMESNGKIFQIQRPLLEGKGDMHFVGATWDDDGHVHLYVDGSK